MKEVTTGVRRYAKIFNGLAILGKPYQWGKQALATVPPLVYNVNFLTGNYFKTNFQYKYMTEGLIASAIALNTALTEIIKRTIPERFNRFIPIIPVVLGVGLTWLFSPGDSSWKDIIFYGLIVGLTSAGTYSATKHIINK